MKKILFTALAILTMSMMSLAGNGGPHTKQYLDIKALIDDYNESLNKAQSCEDLNTYQLTFFMALLSSVDQEYKEDEVMTEAEDKEIVEYMDQIDIKVAQLKEKWDCPEEEEQPEQELTPTSTQEWDEILDSYDAVTKKMEGLKGLDFEVEENMNKLLEVLMEANPVIQRIDQADTSNLTEKQDKRMQGIGQRFLDAAKAIGLVEEDEE